MGERTRVEYKGGGGGREAWRPHNLPHPWNTEPYIRRKQSMGVWFSPIVWSYRTLKKSAAKFP